MRARAYIHTVRSRVGYETLALKSPNAFTVAHFQAQVGLFDLTPHPGAPQLSTLQYYLRCGTLIHMQLSRLVPSP